ncbi:MAG TPA: UvrD-helicase domain-containing protein, partial [Chthonomonadaceae bacterium]|nr:UvrD-helicase domain-containing protein [Chthonomonadaceae bacterium]
LDRDSEMIWYAEVSALSSERQRFAQAHEFAHFWLHPDIAADAYAAEDAPDAYGGAGSAAAQPASGYSPRERREREADTFAAELLLPQALLRRTYITDGLRASEIADATGLSETCVLTQLARALLCPDDLGELPDDRASDPVALDESQAAAAFVKGGPVLVDAGPGTGKTRTLTARIVHLIRDRSVAPEQILALTYTNRAAEEMTDRLQAAAGPEGRRVWTGTFHAFGFELLRKEGHRIGLSAAPKLIEPIDAAALLERNLDLLSLVEFQFLSAPALPLPDILSAISRAKDELKTPSELSAAAATLALGATTEEQQSAAAKTAEIAHVYGVYTDILRQNDLLDFGDLIARSIELLAADPALLDEIRRHYPHVLADEYQDINRATSRLLQMLAGDGAGFWAAGDLRQAIYRFRGASPANVRQFDSDFPGAVRLSLRRNYRSRPSIVRLLVSSAREMGIDSLAPADWSASRSESDGPRLSLVVPRDEVAQADWLAAQIRQRQDRGLPGSSQAVLVPTNRLGDEVAQHLVARGVEVHRDGSLFDRPAVLDILSLLSLAFEPDGIGLLRVARLPHFAIPESDALRILEAARRAGRAFPEAIGWALHSVDFPASTRKGLALLNAALASIQHPDPWRLATRFLFDGSTYLDPWLVGADPAAGRCLRSIAALLRILHSGAAGEGASEAAGGKGHAALEHIRRIIRSGRFSGDRSAAEDDSTGGVRI